MTNDREFKLNTDDLMVKVGELLEGKWTLNDSFSDSYWQTVLDGPDGMGLFVDFSKGGRLFISGGNWPEDTAGHQHSPQWNKGPKISVAGNRGPEVIAAEITRRLLPEYSRQYYEQTAAADESNKRLAKQAKLAGECHAIMPGLIGERSGQVKISHEGYGNITTITSSSEVNIELHYLEARKAKRILRAIKKILDS